MFSDIDNFLKAKSYEYFISHLEGLTCLVVFAYSGNNSNALKLMKTIHELQIQRKELNLIIPNTMNATVLQLTTINYNVLLWTKKKG